MRDARQRESKSEEYRGREGRVKKLSTYKDTKQLPAVSTVDDVICLGDWDLLVACYLQYCLDSKIDRQDIYPDKRNKEEEKGKKEIFRFVYKLIELFD